MTRCIQCGLSQARCGAECPKGTKHKPAHKFPVPVKWDSYRDGITKATVYTLTANGERWSPQCHIEYHGIQVFGERKAQYRGGPKSMRYFPVIRYDKWGEAESSHREGFASVTDAKAWAITEACMVGLLKAVTA